MDYNKLEKRINGKEVPFLNIFFSQKKYYYLTEEYFKNYLGLEFKHFNLTLKEKVKINELGANYFKDKKISFRINKNSNRNALTIINIKELFLENSKINKNKHEYIKEYVLWRILIKIKNKNKDIQRNNFIITYVKYLLERNPKRLVLKGFKEAKSLTDFIDKKNEVDKKIKTLKKEMKKLKKEIETSEGGRIDKIKQEIVRENSLIYKMGKICVNEKYISNLKIIYLNKDAKENLKEILELSTLDAKEKQIFYRGQSNSEWDITASISRETNWLECENEMFYEILSLKPNEFIADKSTYERLITMQHFELPTRLIDLTRNPLIALYFACNSHPNQDGVLFVIEEEKDNILNFDDKVLNCLSKLVLNEDIDCIKKDTNEKCEKCFGLERSYIVKGIAKNDRINNQSGDFIFVGKGNKTKYLKEISQNYTKIIILDKEIKKTILDDLKLLNIHAGTVYPELTSMSGYVKNEYKNRKMDKKLGNVNLTNPFERSKEEINVAKEIPTIVKSNKKLAQLNENIKIDDRLTKQLIKEENLNDKLFKEFIEEYEFSKKVNKELIKKSFIDKLTFSERKNKLEKIIQIIIDSLL